MHLSVSVHLTAVCRAVHVSNDICLLSILSNAWEKTITFFVCLSPKLMQFEMLCQGVWKAWGKSWNCDLLNIKLYRGKLSIPQSGEGLGKMALGLVASSLPSFCSLCPVSGLLVLHDSIGWGCSLASQWYFLSGNCLLLCKLYDLSFVSEEREWQNQIFTYFKFKVKIGSEICPWTAGWESA